MTLVLLSISTHFILRGTNITLKSSYKMQADLLMKNGKYKNAIKEVEFLLKLSKTPEFEAMYEKAKNLYELEKKKRRKTKPRINDDNGLLIRKSEEKVGNEIKKKNEDDDLIVLSDENHSSDDSLEGEVKPKITKKIVKPQKKQVKTAHKEDSKIDTPLIDVPTIEEKLPIPHGIIH